MRHSVACIGCGNHIMPGDNCDYCDGLGNVKRIGKDILDDSDKTKDLRLTTESDSPRRSG